MALCIQITSILCYLQSLAPIIGGVGAGVLVAVAIVVVSIDTRPSPILASFVRPHPLTHIFSSVVCGGDVSVLRATNGSRRLRADRALSFSCVYFV